MVNNKLRGKFLVGIVAGGLVLEGFIDGFCNARVYLSYQQLCPESRKTQQ